ncbi:Swt1 family HEPN domain-containing protein [Hyphomicrobium sp. NDB2Meth4]|uniref:Swt1 family HEPN domain-containing protein n=1 Tax=Hyphomicrobium sp. NDB2Meth4 TaxID=1892846 RepID=UPI000930E1A0|nr:Swt1 family HEPN domain-containing protein [Hyphomicrobium sp. NDB2Meth4]
MKREHALRLFTLNNLALEADLRRVATEHNIDIGRSRASNEDVEQTYYPQFAERLRTEAASMATQYAIFYCLENSIRELIVERLQEVHGSDWWNKVVPDAVKQSCDKNQKKEQAAGITPRSKDLIDYSNFGELGEIIKANWDIFGDTFRDIRALERVLGNLNTLRAPIAHCKALAEDEVTRLHLSLRDWFRQMG